ncbi:MAG: hypothetical protein AAGD22_15460 [Verrucomicrobiota bacterium]
MAEEPTCDIPAEEQEAAWARVRAESEGVRCGLETRVHPPAVLLHSWDGYQRFWGPALYYGALNLPVGVPRFFVSEAYPVDSNGFAPLLTGTGSFAARLLRASEELEGRGFRYVFYLQEDHWLIQHFAASTLEELVDFMESERLVTIKLGRASFWWSDIEKIRKECGWVGESGWGSRLRWFGPHWYGMAHHVCLFQLRFLIETLQVAIHFQQERPLQHEIITSDYMRSRMKQFSEDDKSIRVAVWDEEPVVEYVHAGDCGNLTDEGALRLKADGIDHLYAPQIAGEVFPEAR